MPIEREYWKKAQEGVSLEDYPEVNNDEVQFPDHIHIAFAVCRRECGNSQFIVDGSTQVCDKCGKDMFRTAVKKYLLDRTE